MPSTPSSILTAAPLGIAGTYSGQASISPFLNVGGQYTFLVGISSSDQAGTMYIEQGIMIGAIFTILRSDSLATSADAVSNQSALLKVEIVYPYARISYVNGATGQAFFVLAYNYSDS